MWIVTEKGYQQKKPKILFDKKNRVLVGCSTGFCLTIQNGVGSTGRKSRF